MTVIVTGERAWVWSVRSRGADAACLEIHSRRLARADRQTGDRNTPQKTCALSGRGDPVPVGMYIMGAALGVGGTWACSLRALETSGVGDSVSEVFVRRFGCCIILLVKRNGPSLCLRGTTVEARGGGVTTDKISQVCIHMFIPNPKLTPHPQPPPSHASSDSGFSLPNTIFSPYISYTN